MGKQGKSKFRLFGFLPKVASAVAFLSPPTSPRMGNTGKGSSGPVISLVPKEARRRIRSGSFDAREPRSPKVSCMGQVKKNNNKKTVKLQESTQVTKSDSCPHRKKQALIKSKISDGGPPAPAAEKVPSLGHMKQYSSSRGVLKDFDWKGHDGSGMRDNPIYVADSEPVGVDAEIPLEPKKEVNLWRRRSRTPPIPLQLEKL